MRTGSSQVTQIAQRFAAKGRIELKDVDTLIDATMQGACTPEKRADLGAVLKRYQNVMEPEGKERLNAFLAIGDDNIRNFFHAANYNDSYKKSRGGHLELEDAVNFARYAKDKGDFSLDERDSLLAAANAYSLKKCRTVVDCIAKGTPLSQDKLDCLLKLHELGQNLTQVPPEYMEDPDFVCGVTEVCRRVDIPPEFAGDEDFQRLLMHRLQYDRDAAKAIAPIKSRELLKEMIEEGGGRLIEYGSSELRKDPELVKQALVGKHPAHWGQVDDSFRQQREFALLAIKDGADSIFAKCAEYFPADHELISLATQTSYFNLRHVDKEYQRAHPEIVFQALEATNCRFHNQYSFEFLHDDFLRDEKFILATVAVSGTHILSQIDDSFLADPAFMRKAIKLAPDSIGLASSEIKKETKLAMLAVKGDPSTLGLVDASLREDRKLVSAAVKQDPTTFALAGPKYQQQHKKQALHALQQGGKPLKLDSQLLTDREFVLDAVKAVPGMLEHCSDFQDDKEVVYTACEQSCHALSYSPLAQSKTFVGRLVDEVGGAVLPFADCELRGDKALVKKAIVDCPLAFEYASPELRADKELAHLAVHGHTMAYIFVSPELRSSDKELALLALRRSASVWDDVVPEPLKFDPDVLVAAVSQDPNLVPEVPESLLGDMDFLTRLLVANPRALDTVPLLRRKVHKMHRHLKAEYVEQKNQMTLLNIEFPNRFGTNEMTQEILKNRTSPRDPQDERPTALLVFPKTDHNGAFEIHNMDDLGEHYRVLYYEVGSVDEFAASCRDLDKRGEKAQLTIVAGHGCPTALAFGASDPAVGIDTSVMDAYLHRETADVLLGTLDQVVAPGGDLVLESCLNGEGREGADNIANMMAEIVPGTNVWASTVAGNSNWRFDQDGFESPGFWEGKATTYKVRVEDSAQEIRSLR